MRRYTVLADLAAYGHPPMPVAAFYTWPAAWGFAWLARVVTGLPTTVNSN